MKQLLTLLILFFSIGLAAQQPTASTPSARADLEKKRESIIQSIKYTQDQLEATKKDKSATVAQLRALQNKLHERQRLINNINEEIAEINHNINNSSKEITNLKQNLETLKIRYAQSIRYAYKNRSSYDMLAFLFSSTDFNQAIRRMKYLKKYRDYRKEQADQIRYTQVKIQEKIGVLNTVKNEKSNLKSSEEEQKKVLVNETNEKDKVVEELKGREKELMKDIEKNRLSMKKLEQTINKIIQQEIAIAAKKAEEERRKKEAQEKAAAVTYGTGTDKVRLGESREGNQPENTTSNEPGKNNTKPVLASNIPKPSTYTPPKKAASSYISTLTPEATELSNKFEMNKGRLPWPVEKGVISSYFGRHKHAVAEKVMIDNNGIDIDTNPGAIARAVFEGEVTKVVYIPGLEYTVIINHGAYFSVYARLKSVTVKADQKVATKQTIGTVAENDEGVPSISFQIWKVTGTNSSKVDPEPWIAR